MKPSLDYMGYALILLLLVFAAPLLGQTSDAKKPDPTKVSGNIAAATPAYAELLLRKTELLSELESLVIEYTNDFPRVKEIRYALALIERDFGRIGRVKPADSGKLTLALGKLMVRKVELESDLWKLQGNYKDEHPDVKRAKRRVEIYETAVSEILN